jgi:hypothetical protein
MAFNFFSCFFSRGADFFCKKCVSGHCSHDMDHEQPEIYESLGTMVIWSLFLVYSCRIFWWWQISKITWE